MMKSEKQRLHLKRLSQITRTEEWKNKIRESKISEKNPMWRGEKVGYRALHAWVKRNSKKPKKCQNCKEVPPYDLANKGTYNRNFENWEWLCRRCHMIKDGRMKIWQKRNVFRGQSGVREVQNTKKK